MSDLRISEMSVRQRATYWKRQARRWERRAKDLLVLAEDKYGIDLRPDLQELARLRAEAITTSNERNHP